MYENNVFRRGGLEPNISKAPQEVQKALSDNVPFRPGEVVGRVMTTRHAVNLRGARIFPAFESLVSDRSKTVNLTLLDFTGKREVGMVELDVSALGTLLPRLLDFYAQSGGDLEELLSKAKPTP